MLSIAEKAIPLLRRYGFFNLFACIFLEILLCSFGRYFSSALHSLYGRICDSLHRIGNQITGLITSGYEERFECASSFATQFTKRNGMTEEFLNNLTDFWRDLMLIKIGAVDSVTNIHMLAELRKQANAFSIEQIRKFIGEVRAAGRQLELNANPRLVLEVLMLNMPQAAKAAPQHSTVDRQ